MSRRGLKGGRKNLIYLGSSMEVWSVQEVNVIFVILEVKFEHLRLSRSCLVLFCVLNWATQLHRNIVNYFPQQQKQS